MLSHQLCCPHQRIWLHVHIVNQAAINVIILDTEIVARQPSPLFLDPHTQLEVQLDLPTLLLLDVVHNNGGVPWIIFLPTLELCFCFSKRYISPVHELWNQNRYKVVTVSAPGTLPHCVHVCEHSHMLSTPDSDGLQKGNSIW